MIMFFCKASRRAGVLSWALAALLCIWCAALPLAAMAVEPDEVFADKRLETRARALSAQLRCLVCQNQSIDDSAAPLARDVRLLVRERIKAGDTDAQIRDFLVARYGDFILLTPPWRPDTWLLWLTPALTLALGAFLARGLIRRDGEEDTGLQDGEPDASDDRTRP
jgi:cytochrome c-type biogenesis protein CcmH